MSLPAKIKTPLTKIALLAAATIATTTFADESNSAAATINISNADEFREALAVENDNDGATLKISENFTIQVNPPPETDSDTGDNLTIEPVATNFTISGNGSGNTTLTTNGNGDLLWLTDTSPIYVENITVAGANTVTADDLSTADGRAFTIVGGTLIINGDTTFSDRFFSAVTTTSFGSIGGAIVSTTISDTLVFDSSAGDILFSGITAYGATLTITETTTTTDEETGEETTTTTTTDLDLSAGGSALYLSGTLTLRGSGTIAFVGNTSESVAANAMGGAVYVVNSTYSSDGTGVAYDAQSDATYGIFGFVANAGTTLEFSGNKSVAAGAAGGGAVFVYGGEFIAKGGTMSFTDNLASAAGNNSVGGALAASNYARVTFEAGTTLSFAGNRAESAGEFSEADGGAIYSEALVEILSDAENSTFATAKFSDNSAVATGDGSSAFGGAIASYGDDATFSAAGTFAFSGNNVVASGEIKEYTETDSDGTVTTSETYIPEAGGGAIAAVGGAFSLSSPNSAASLEFSENAATTTAEGTFASGGAIYVSGDDTTTNFDFSGATNFTKNSANAGDNATARGGAIAIVAGTTNFSSTTNPVEFSENFAAAGNGGEAQGGAIFQADGTLAITAGSGAWKFSGNRAEAATVATTTDDDSDDNGGGNNGVATGTTASGGAIYQSGGTMEFSTEASVEFSQNTATGATAQGGAIFQSGGTQTFSTTVAGATIATFAGNSALATSSVAEDLYAQGGAIVVKSAGSLTLAGATTFTGNSASAQSSAASSDSGEDDDGNDDLTVSASGGAIYSSGTITLADATFASNSATAAGGTYNYAQGGALYVSGGNFAAGTLSFSGNSATVADAATGRAQGGAVYQSSGKINLTSLTADSNSATAGIAQGGAIFSRGFISVLFDDAGDNATFSLTNNSATSRGTLAQGGAIYSAGTIEIRGSGSLAFSGNSATAGSSDSTGAIAAGGAIYSSGTFVSDSVTTSAFDNNSATANGDSAVAAGGFYFSQNGETKISGTTTIDADGNIAPTTTISGNSASVATSDSDTGSAFGGAIYLAGGNHEFSNVKITGNSASVAGSGTAAGGAIYLDASGTLDTTLTISGNTEISGNSISVAGEQSASGISVGNGTAETSNSNVSIVISAGADFTTETDDDGNTTTTRSNAETVKILDPITVELTGDAGFSLSKDDAGGDFVWGCANVIEVESGNFELSFGAGNTTLQSGFSLSGTTISGIVVASGATLTIESGATLGNFAAMTVAGDVDVRGAMNFSGATVAVDDAGSLNFHAGTSSEISGATTISGALRVLGNVEFSTPAIIVSGDEDDADAGETAVSLEISKLVLAADDSTAPALSFVVASSDGDESAGTLTLSVAEIDVEDSGTITLDNNTTLYVETIATTNPDAETECKFEGTGTIVFLDEAEEDGTIAFNSYYDEDAGEYVAGAFSIASGITVASGISISNSATVSLGNNGIDYKYVYISGGTLLAPETSEENPLTLYDLTVARAGATLGEAGANQFFKVVVDPNASDEDDEGDDATTDDSTDSGDSNDSGDNATTDSGSGNDDGGDSDDSGVETARIAIVAAEGDDSSGDSGDNNADAGDDDAGETINSVSVAGPLEITESTTLVADIVLGSATYAALNGEGTLVGDVSGQGKIGIKTIDGNVTVAEARTLTFTNTTTGTTITGAIKNYGTIAVSDNVYVSAGSWTNSGNINVGSAVRLGGAIENSGTITVNGSLTFAQGSTFTLTTTGTLAVASGAVVDFSEISGTPGAVSLSAGTIELNTSAMRAGETLTALVGLEEGQLDGVNIKNTASVNLADRIVWNDNIQAYVYLGLEGRSYRTTLYADLLHENVLRTYDFMETAIVRRAASSIEPQIFDNTGKASRYMRNYVENQRRNNPEAEVPQVVDDGKPGDYLKTLETFVYNSWVQGQYKHSRVSADGENPSYQSDFGGIMGGSSLTFAKSWEIGGALQYEFGTMKHSGSNSHKITTNATDLMLYLGYSDTIDFTLAVAGSLGWHDSKREGLDADINSWQIGLLWDNGVTLAPETWLAIRPYYSAEAVYTRSGSFSEKSPSNGYTEHLSLDSGDALAFRGKLGLSVAFLPINDLQITMRAAALLDLGDKTYSIDAYESSTNSHVSVTSHENERFGVEMGAFLNYRITNQISLFGGYTATIRAGEQNHRANVGVTFSF